LHFKKDWLKIQLLDKKTVLCEFSHLSRKSP
jgi:hypothetical protein